MYTLHNTEGNSLKDNVKERHLPSVYVISVSVLWSRHHLSTVFSCQGASQLPSYLHKIHTVLSGLTFPVQQMLQILDKIYIFRQCRTTILLDNCKCHSCYRIWTNEAVSCVTFRPTLTPPPHACNNMEPPTLH